MMALCKHKSAITWVQRAIKHIKPELPAALTVSTSCSVLCVTFAVSRVLRDFSGATWFVKISRGWRKSSVNALYEYTTVSTDLIESNLAKL